MLAIKYKNPSTRLFESVFDELFDFPTLNTGVRVPIYDVIENDNEYQIQLQLVGVKKEDINIDVEKDVLTIKAERKEVKDLKYNHKESYFGKYERSFILPDDVDKENIGASLEDGILKIVVPKLENKASISKKAIEIK